MSACALRVIPVYAQRLKLRNPLAILSDLTVAAALCQFGNSRGISRIPRFVPLDLDYGQAFHSRMAKLAPGRRSLTHAVMAGVLAWLLVL
jgi:hypothetical protein